MNKISKCYQNESIWHMIIVFEITNQIVHYYYYHLIIIGLSLMITNDLTGNSLTNSRPNNFIFHTFN